MPRIALLARLALLVGLARGYLRPGPLRSFEPVRWLTDRAVDPALGPPLALGEDVALAPSRGKGTGVFARRALGAGEFVARYTGIIRTEEDVRFALREGLTSGLYSFRLDCGLFIDAEFPDRSGWARYINHSRGPKRNCELLALEGVKGGRGLLPPWFAGTIYLRTFRPVAAGEELLYSYGRNYWDAYGRKNGWVLGRADPRRLVADNL